MSCNPEPVDKTADHKLYKALTIGNDAVLPATGVRGALRTLMTILSGGTLGYMDEELWLTQRPDEDAQLGPNSKMPGVPDRAFLAEVVKPGSGISAGTVQLGETKLRKAEDLKKHIKDLDYHRPTNKRQTPLTYTDFQGEKWKVKLSGRPINSKGKKEGLFRGTGDIIELSEAFWSTYQGRYRHAVHSELKKGDLIWLEPMDPSCRTITCEADIKSIQWSRWGRRGVALKKLIPHHVLPDSMRPDGGVDMVTNLFGQIPKQRISAAGPFAARIRPGNLIFFDAGDKTVTETLAPLAAPHPGCMAFYRDQGNLDEINKMSPLKGYKVYRNTSERGDKAPWKYSVQGVYGEQGALKSPQQKVNKTAELIGEGITGKLRIAFRALDADELALLYAACSVDWKLGGGKPLGLGHCRVTAIRMIDEEGNTTYPMESVGNGENLKLSEKYAKRVVHLENRIALYRTSQIPVEKLRYPRAVTGNKNKSTKAGLAWFARHASPRKSKNGLETIWTTGALQLKVKSSQIKAQAIPNLMADDPYGDQLYGYDMIELDVNTSQRNQRMVGRMEKFEAALHASPHEKAGQNISQNRDSRTAARAQRSSEPPHSSVTITKKNIGTMITEEHKKQKITPARAREFLKKMEEFGITRNQSNKWKKKFKLLEENADK